MIFSRDQEINSITLFSDSQILINTIIKHEMKLEIYDVFRDIYLLSTAFISIMFIFIPRAANVKVDSVAKQAMWALNNV